MYTGKQSSLILKLIKCIHKKLTEANTLAYYDMELGFVYKKLTDANTLAYYNRVLSIICKMLAEANTLAYHYRVCNASIKKLTPGIFNVSLQIVRVLI
jgi:hypothetical protein